MIKCKHTRLSFRWCFHLHNNLGLFDNIILISTSMKYSDKYFRWTLELLFNFIWAWIFMQRKSRYFNNCFANITCEYYHTLQPSNKYSSAICFHLRLQLCRGIHRCVKFYCQIVKTHSKVEQYFLEHIILQTSMFT